MIGTGTNRPPTYSLMRYDSTYCLLYNSNNNGNVWRTYYHSTDCVLHYDYGVVELLHINGIFLGATFHEALS